MEELQLMSLEITEITSWDFEAVKEDLVRALSVYKSTIYTDDTIKIAKDDKSQLAKAEKMIDGQRKAFKAKCMEPYNTIEPQVKELLAIIEEQKSAIDEVVKDYDNRKKSEKETEIRTYYDKKAQVLGDLASSLFDKILDKKWLTASSGKKYKEEIQIKINDVLEDINVLKGLNSPFINTVLEKYVATLSVDEAMAKHEELAVAASKAGLGLDGNKQISTTLVNNGKVDSEEGTFVRLCGSEKLIAQVLDFAKAIGITVEIQ